MGVFRIKADNFEWIGGAADDPQDLCLHGHVTVQFGDTVLEDTGTVSATALYLLKTLTNDKLMAEYRELTYYGSYTLQYVFSQFLEGGQTGLRGHLMRSVLDDLAPEAQLRLYAETGQEYFDEWKAGAIRISEQHDMEWIKENQPAIWLLLQMIDE